MFQEARMGKAIDAEAAAPLVEEISNSVMRNPGSPDQSGPPENG